MSLLAKFKTCCTFQPVIIFEITVTSIFDLLYHTHKQENCQEWTQDSRDLKGSDEAKGISIVSLNIRLGNTGGSGGSALGFEAR